jgi:hypothetical protein
MKVSTYLLSFFHVIFVCLLSLPLEKLRFDPISLALIDVEC